MLKNIFLIALLASAVFTQDAVVTHYDLDGNVIAEEVQAVNEEVVSPMMGESSDKEMADKAQLHSSPLNEISDAPQQNQQSIDMVDDGFNAPMMETDSLAASQDANDQLIQSEVNLETETQTQIKEQLDEQLNTQPEEWTSQVTSSDDITGINLEKQIDDSLNEAQEGTTNAWVQSETDIDAQKLVDEQLNNQQGTTTAWEESNIIDTTKLVDDSLQQTEGQDAWVQSEANLEAEAEAEKAKKAKKPQADSTLDDQENQAQPNIAENVSKNADIKESDDDIDSPHSDRDKDKPHPGAETQAVNPQEVKNETKYEEGEENQEPEHEGEGEGEGQELQSTDQSQKNLVQGSCIIIYSQCQFKGDQMEVCQSLNEIEKFQHDIMSIYIPKGLGLTVYDSENFEGKSHKYTTSQNCLKYPVSFAQLSSKSSKKLSHNNLRRK
ncbi:hypothetical protein pb186bvf_003511 [Paramecium bursaria]